MSSRVGRQKESLLGMWGFMKRKKNLVIKKGRLSVSREFLLRNVRVKIGDE